MTTISQCKWCLDEHPKGNPQGAPQDSCLPLHWKQYAATLEKECAQLVVAMKEMERQRNQAVSSMQAKDKATKKPRTVKQTIMCGIPLDSLDYWSSYDVWFPTWTSYTLVITYPFNKAGYYRVNTGKGLGMIGLLEHVRRAFYKQYYEADKGKNGYWHTTDEVFIEGIVVDHKKREIRLQVGS